jgi:hypothetical protein
MLLRFTEVAWLESRFLPVGVFAWLPCLWELNAQRAPSNCC